jgi:hypothetical protein
MKTSAGAPALYTIGHSSRPLAELIEALRAVSVVEPCVIASGGLSPHAKSERLVQGSSDGIGDGQG